MSAIHNLACMRSVFSENLPPQTKLACIVFSKIGVAENIANAASEYGLLTFRKSVPHREIVNKRMLVGLILIIFL